MPVPVSTSRVKEAGFVNSAAYSFLSALLSPDQNPTC